MRPSQLYDISDSYDAYCFDSAVSEFGAYVLAEMDKVPSGKNERANDQRRKAKLKSLLEDQESRRFADPAAMFKKG